MRRMTVVLLMVFVLAAVLVTAAPASAKDRRDRGNRNTYEQSNEWKYRRQGGSAYRWSPGQYSRPEVDRQWRDRNAYQAPYRGGYTPHPYTYNRPSPYTYNRPSPYPYPYNGYRAGYGYQYRPFYGYRYPRPIYVPRQVFVTYPDYVTVVEPVYYDNVVLLPHQRYQVVERYPDRFVLILSTGILTVILRG